MSADQKRKTLVAAITKFMTPLLLIAAGGAAWAYLNVTAPVIERAVPKRQAAVVQVQTAKPTDIRTTINAMGTVTAARQVTLKSRVAGEIESVAEQFVPGGILNAGDVLLSLDRADHEITVQKAQSALEDARAALAMEQGNQTVAREEVQLLSELSPDVIARTDLALRKPQLQQARAAVANAEADLRQARLNLQRTVVRVPFNALVIDRNVDVGACVGTQESLATIVGTDAFWIEAVVPLDQLARIDFDYPGGCPAVIRSQSGAGRRHGTVVRIAGQLNETSRMATVLLSVTDPLGLASPDAGAPLMIDDYVFVEITGRQLSGVIELPRAALQDGDTVWIKDGSDSLDIRPVTLAWKRDDTVYIQDGLAPGELVVTSELATPVQGMPLMVTASDSDVDAPTVIGE